MSWEGPLPPPGALEAYEKIHPGAAECIITEFVKQADHRQELEKLVVGARTTNMHAGRRLGFCVAVLFFVAVMYALYQNNTIAAAILGGINMGSLVSVFVIGSRSQRKEREAKRDQ